MRKAHQLRALVSFIPSPFQSMSGVRPRRHKLFLSCVMLVMLVFSLLATSDLVMANSLDPIFGTGGKVLTDSYPNKSESAEKVLIQTDGKIVVVGYRYSIYCSIPLCFRDPDPIMVRYNVDGSLDPLFGSGGHVFAALSTWAFLYDAVLQPDGKIVAVGTYDPASPVGTQDFLIMRFYTTGSLDTSFDGDGIATISFGTNREDAKNVGLQSDGKIVVSGVSKTYDGTPYAVMVRYNTNGSLDTTFGTSGLVILGIQAHNALIIQPDDKILLGGGGSLGANAQVVRYNSNGTIDTSFGSATTAVAEVAFGPTVGGSVQALALQLDGKIVLGVNYDGFSIARLNVNGSLDSSFGLNGRNLTIFPPALNTIPLAIAVQADGGIVVAGWTYNPPQNENFALARFNPDGTVSGRVTTDFDSKVDIARSVAIQSDGKIVAAGDSIPTGGGPTLLLQDIAVTRYVDIEQQFRTTLFDFDGDTRSDIAVYRPGASSTAQSYWHIMRSGTNTYQQIQFGIGEDIIVPGDYNGDSRTDVAVFRPSTGVWYTSTDPSINYGAIQWGQNGDIPVPGDYTNDGRADLAVYRPSNGTWYVRTTGTGSVIIRQFGGGLDKPVPADYDDDGKTDFAYINESAGNLVWNILRSSDSVTVTTPFGITGDKAVPADYQGDGSADIAVFRQSTGRWYNSLNPATNYGELLWGQNGDVPAPADYDGDGKADHAVFRPGNTVFYIRQSTNGGLAYLQWGIPTDTPVPSAYVR